MSGFVNFFKRGADSVLKGVGLKQAFHTLDNKQPAEVQNAVGDQALVARDGNDRIRRRRGVLANIFAGSNASSPTVGSTTLGGG